MRSSQRKVQLKVFDSLPHTKTENPFAMTPNPNPQMGFLTSSTSLEASQAAPLVLTNAERTIALLVAEGARNHDIARQLGVSHRTVESHLSNIFTKLGIGSRVQLALWISSSAQSER
jgi:DNA-binding NarL/FixJ family response regulator